MGGEREDDPGIHAPGVVVDARDPAAGLSLSGPAWEPARTHVRHPTRIRGGCP